MLELFNAEGIVLVIDIMYKCRKAMIVVEPMHDLHIVWI